MRLSFLLAFLLILTGCPSEAPPEDPDTFDDDEVEAVETATWSADLTGRAGFEDISGGATATVDDNQTNVSASIEGAPAGGNHPWHIHEGSCDTGGGIVGDAGAYPALQVGDDGGASASATIGVALSAGASYHVNVHAAPDDLGTIVACGNLRQN